MRWLCSLRVCACKAAYACVRICVRVHGCACECVRTSGSPGARACVSILQKCRIA